MTPRIVTTADELDALPVGTILRDAEGAALQHRAGAGHPYYEDGWYFGDEHHMVMVPATVIWEPTS